MANKKITQLSALTAPAGNDLLAIVDVSDTTMGATGTTKKITYSNLLGGALGVLSATATLDFPSISANSVASLTMTVTGAKVGDAVFVGAPAGLEASLVVMGFVSATDEVTIRAHNASGGSVDPASATYRATVFNYS
jgi:hypothetical protein